MVASRRKIKAQQQEGAEGTEAMVEERKLKVKKRKEGKQQAAKEAAAAAATEGEKSSKKRKSVEEAEEWTITEDEPAEEGKRPKKKKAKKSEAQNEENATAEGEEPKDDVAKKQKKKKSKKTEEDATPKKVAEEGDDDEIVLNVKTPKADENAETEPEKKKKQKKKKQQQLDRWGNPVVANEPQSEAPAPSGDAQGAQDRGYGDTAVDEYVPRKVFVTGMPFTTSMDDIHNFFAESGVIEDLELSYFADTGRFKGMAFITFKTEAAMNNALELNGSEMGNRCLTIEKCKARKSRPYREPPQKMEGCLSAYIGNLSWEVTEDALVEFFSGCNIKAIRFAEDKETGEFKGFGHIDFYDDESLERAVKMNQELLLGRSMKIAYAVGKTRENSGTRNVGKAKACYKCGEEGHFAIECPKNV